MNPYQIIFPFGETQKIIINLKDQFSLIGWNVTEPIFFQNYNKIIIIADHPIYFNIRDMRDFLKKALNNDLPLHESITSDIGYLSNQYSKNNKGFVIERFPNGFEGWVGYRYHMWYAYENKSAYTTWIYNDHNNNIIFKITPDYPYFSSDRRKKEHYIPFKKWILNYKPYFATILSRELAQQWLKQAEYFVETVDDNIVRWEKEYKQINHKK